MQSAWNGAFPSDPVWHSQQCDSQQRAAIASHSPSDCNHFSDVADKLYVYLLIVSTSLIEVLLESTLPEMPVMSKAAEHMISRLRYRAHKAASSSAVTVSSAIAAV